MTLQELLTAISNDPALMPDLPSLPRKYSATSTQGMSEPDSPPLSPPPHDEAEADAFRRTGKADHVIGAPPPHHHAVVALPPGTFRPTLYHQPSPGHSSQTSSANSSGTSSPCPLLLPVPIVSGSSPSPIPPLVSQSPSDSPPVAPVAKTSPSQWMGYMGQPANQNTHHLHFSHHPRHYPPIVASPLHTQAGHAVMEYSALPPLPPSLQPATMHIPSSNTVPHYPPSLYDDPRMIPSGATFDPRRPVHTLPHLPAGPRFPYEGKKVYYGMTPALPSQQSLTRTDQEQLKPSAPARMIEQTGKRGAAPRDDHHAFSGTPEGVQFSYEASVFSSAPNLKPITFINSSAHVCPSPTGLKQGKKVPSTFPSTVSDVSSSVGNGSKANSQEQDSRRRYIKRLKITCYPADSFQERPSKSTIPPQPAHSAPQSKPAVVDSERAKKSITPPLKTSPVESSSIQLPLAPVEIMPSSRSMNVTSQRTASPSPANSLAPLPSSPRAASPAVAILPRPSHSMPTLIVSSASSLSSSAVSASPASSGSSTPSHGSPIESTLQDAPEPLHLCLVCGKTYKHASCLSKHAWEHTDYWAEAKKVAPSKHQQVQIMEAAQMLLELEQMDHTNPNQHHQDMASTRIDPHQEHVLHVGLPSGDASLMGGKRKKQKPRAKGSASGVVKRNKIKYQPYLGDLSAPPPLSRHAGSYAIPPPARHLIPSLPIGPYPGVLIPTPHSGPYMVGPNSGLPARPPSVHPPNRYIPSPAHLPYPHLASLPPLPSFHAPPPAVLYGSRSGSSSSSSGSPIPSPPPQAPC